jgi:SpoVK/Ycf46/Vps4 family AAA+-type ATPase
VASLFVGDPGTGKTMAAEIIAAELGLDLYKIDLSGLVSKYIGETEKNLARVFDEAGDSNAILFFDEADAIFGKRTEVRDSHDRYANIEVSYLLQKMEEHDGIVVLASNLRANLDDAFLRRLKAIIDFPFPEEEDRLAIYRRMLAGTSAPLAEDVDLPFMARQFRIAGGNIKNIIILAAFLAAESGSPIAMRHLIHATRREYQKLGRLLTESDFADWYEEVQP